MCYKNIIIFFILVSYFCVTTKNLGSGLQVKRRRRVNGKISKIFCHIKEHGDQPGRELFCLPSGLATFTPFALRSVCKTGQNICTIIIKPVILVLIHLFCFVLQVIRSGSVLLSAGGRLWDCQLCSPTWQHGYSGRGFRLHHIWQVCKINLIIAN